MDQNRETLGRYLKRERESHRAPVQEIALFVGVNRSRIDALERDDFDPSARRSEYVRLIKRYTAYLKLNRTEALRLFDAQWKQTGGVKRYPKLTQYADVDPSPVKPVLFKGERRPIGRSPGKRAGLPVVVGALIVISILLMDLTDTKREITQPAHRPPSGTAIGVPPAAQRVPPPAAGAERRTASPKQPARPETPPPRPGVAGGKIPPPPQEVQVIGNRDSKRYHLPGMKYHDAVKAYHRVVFRSERDAVRAGYRKARE